MSETLLIRLKIRVHIRQIESVLLKVFLLEKLKLCLT